MILVILRHDLNLDKVLVGAEEGEILEEALPGDGRGALVLDQLVRDFGCLFKLREHHILRRLTHVVCRIHGGEGRCDDWHQSFRVRVVEQLGIDVKLYRFCFVGNLAERQRILRAPVVVAIVLKEPIKELVGSHIWIITAYFGSQDGPSDTSQVTHDI